MIAFTIITGVATLLGFLLQIRDIFPTHRETRKTLVILIAGIFLGCVLSALIGVKMEIGQISNPVQIGISLLIFCVLLFVITQGLRSLIAKNAQNRAEAVNMAGNGFVIFCVCLIGGCMVFTDSSKPQLTVDETLALIHKNEDIGNYDRAIYLASQLRITLVARNDSRVQQLDSILKELARKQFLVEKVRTNNRSSTESQY